MKAKAFLYLCVAAAVLAAAALYVHRRDADAWQEQALPAGAVLLGNGFPVNDVAVVLLRGPEGAVTLRRGERGWVVAERSDYPASFEKISSLVRTFSGMQAVQSVPLAESDRGSLQLREPAGDVPPEEAGVAVELQDAGGADLASLVLGKIHHTAPPGMSPETGGSATGRYVVSAKRPGNAYLTGETFAGLQTSPAAWIDQAFVRPGTAQRIEVKSAGKDRSWVLERKEMGGEWELAGVRKKQPLDSAKVLSLDSLLNGMAVADATDGPEDGRVRSLQETPVVITVDSFDGVRHRFHVGEGAGDNLPVRVEVEALPSEPGATEEQAAALGEKIAEAARFTGATVFIPRSFFEPFFVTRASLITTRAPAKKP